MVKICVKPGEKLHVWAEKVSLPRSTSGGKRCVQPPDVCSLSPRTTRPEPWTRSRSPPARTLGPSDPVIPATSTAVNSTEKHRTRPPLPGERLPLRSPAGREVVSGDICSKASACSGPGSRYVEAVCRVSKPALSVPLGGLLTDKSGLTADVTSSR